MPNLLISLMPKSLRQVEVGELFRTRLNGGLAICVCAEILSMQKLLAILGPVRDGYPAHIVISDGNLPCLSYGTDWVIDVQVGDESYPGNGYNDPEIGTLYLDDGSAILRLPRAGSSDPDSHFEIDILGAGRREAGRNAMPVKRWSIWAGEIERCRPGTSPVVRFGGAASTIDKT